MLSKVRQIDGAHNTREYEKKQGFLEDNVWRHSHIFLIYEEILLTKHCKNAILP